MGAHTTVCNRLALHFPLTHTIVPAECNKGINRAALGGAGPRAAQDLAEAVPGADAAHPLRAHSGRCRAQARAVEHLVGTPCKLGTYAVHINKPYCMDGWSSPALIDKCCVPTYVQLCHVCACIFNHTATF